MRTPSYTGGWKSIYYSLHVVKEVGLGEFTRSITSKNTCKTCAYGMGGQKGGMVNEDGDTIEICKKSMQAMLTDIQKGIPSEFWGQNSLAELRKLRPRELERLGRLQDPIFKGKNDNAYKVISWQEAFDKIIHKFKATDPNRSFFYASGRSGNEAAFLLHLYARVYGTNNVNNCSYYCHQASGVGMGSVIGTGTATIELSDLKKADLVFVIGANPASNHPRFLTELLHLRRRGGNVIVINPAKEQGMVRFSIPSDVRSLLSTGTAIASEYLQPRIGGDMAVIYGIAKYVLEQGAEDKAFVKNNCENFDIFKTKVNDLSWEEIVSNSQISKAEIIKAAELYIQGKNVVFTWAMGITHHQHGVENVEAIVNLAMLRGMLGRENAGLLPLRGHSNVQGIGTVGVTPVLKGKIFENIEEKLGIKLPTTVGWDTMKCMEEADKGNVDVAFILGGNLYASNPNLNFAKKALDNIPFKVFLNTTLNEGHIQGIEGESLILPVLTRDEEAQRTTQESMFNFVRWSDGGIERIKNAKSEVEIIATIAKDVVPKTKLDFAAYLDHKNIRNAIAVTIPGFEKLSNDNEEFHISGRIKHNAIFDTPSGKAIFKFNGLPKAPENKDSFTLMSVRSEGQFNSIVYEEDDAWRGTTHRNVILMNPEDIAAKGLKDGDSINVKSKAGEIKNFEAFAFNISRGSVLGYYPETNFLVGSEVDPRSRTPAFKATEVWIEKV
ncbi:oxidoreductase alpha (molybdopterin) subunit [Spirosomataceae bacterium TFI 002]|nr:oxidoreductase alpha (molybdopterin) subunit [Spirosomataceae bacterium TFI 002]